jgi:hypothetical protein
VGINGIRLGTLASGAGKVADPSGFNQTDGLADLVTGFQEVTFITSGRFEDEVGTGMGAEPAQEALATREGVGELEGATRQGDLKFLLGDIDADIEDRCSVRAHTCTCELALMGRSINGSSYGHRRPGNLARPEALWL